MIHSDSGTSRFEPDLAIDDYCVAIQYEGTAFHSSPEAVRRDVRRAEIAEQLGWLEVRLTKDHMLQQGRRAVEKVKRALRARGWSG